jgi:hypothetical protein
MVVTALAIGEIVDLFVRWAPRHTETGFSHAQLGIKGLDTPMGREVLLVAIALLVWQITRLAGVRLTARSDETVEAMLGLAVAFVGGAAVAYLSWDSYYSFGTNLAYGAQIQVVISVALAGIGLLSLSDLRPKPG